MRGALALVAALAAGACVTPAPRVQLPRAPTSDAPYAERAAYYKSYALDSREADHLFLHGGTRVFFPEDLLPAVDDESPAAAAIRDHVAAREKVEEWTWLVASSGVAGLVGLGGTVGVLGVLVFPFEAVGGDDIERVAFATTGLTALAGFGVCLAGLGANAVIVGHDEREAAEAADRAVRTYPQALSDRLGVGVDADGRIVDQVFPSTTSLPTKGTP